MLAAGDIPSLHNSTQLLYFFIAFLKNRLDLC